MTLVDPNVIREVSAHDFRFGWRNLTNTSIGGQRPTQFLYDYQGSSGSHAATRLNQIYYLGNEPEAGSLNCSGSSACSCVSDSGGVLVRPPDPGTQCSDYDCNFDPSVRPLFSASNPFWDSVIFRARPEALAQIFQYVKSTVEGLGRGHVVLPPSATDPFRACCTRPYYGQFFTKLASYFAGARIPGDYLRALHFHLYSPLPYIAGQSETPLKSMAFTAALIKLGVDWYANNFNNGPDRRFSILLSEFGLDWQSLYLSSAYAGYWNNFMDGLAWWNSLLCWVTRRAPFDCNLYNWSTGENTIHACIHVPDQVPYCILGGPETNATSTGRNQWFFHADAWTTYYKPQALGYNISGLQPKSGGQYLPVYQTFFTSFRSDADDGSGFQWADSLGTIRNWHRTPFGACYAVWADPKVGAGPNSGDLNTGWVWSAQTGFVGQAQVTLLAGYSTVYFPIIKSSGANSISFSVQFTDGYHVYTSTGSMNLNDLESYQFITIQDGAEFATIESFPAMVYPFVCYSSVPRTLTVRVNRGGSGNAFVGHPVVLPGACSWFITQ